MSKDITLTLTDPDSLASDDIRFRVDSTDYHRLVNAMSGKDKIAPTQNFVMSCCHPDDKTTLKEYLKQDGMGLLIGGELVEHYMPRVMVTVKKPETGPTASNSVN